MNFSIHIPLLLSLIFMGGLPVHAQFEGVDWGSSRSVVEKAKGAPVEKVSNESALWYVSSLPGVREATFSGFKFLDNQLVEGTYLIQQTLDSDPFALYDNLKEWLRESHDIEWDEKMGWRDVDSCKEWLDSENEVYGVAMGCLTKSVYGRTESSWIYLEMKSNLHPDMGWPEVSLKRGSLAHKKQVLEVRQ